VIAIVGAIVAFALVRPHEGTDDTTTPAAAEPVT